jgi:ubiquinone/menaquinone biosynthesis C-methylase UbiE
LHSRRSISRLLAAFALALLAFVPVAAQQTALTEGQIKAAELEVPELAKLFELKPGMTVADVGAGFGAWTVRFSKAVGPSGRVYATDIGAPQLAALRDAVQREGLTNVTVLDGAVSTTNLPALCCDAILIRDAYHHLTQPDAIVKSLAAALKPGARLAVIDFPPRPKSEVPSGVPADRLGHGVPPEVVQREVGAVLTHMRTISTWAPGSQPADLYLVLFRKAGG